MASIGSIKNILGAFQFSGDDADKKIGILSGGEKSRVMLACMLSVPVNFLVLDEPTNHLDIHHQIQLLDTVRGLGRTVLAAVHDLSLAAFAVQAHWTNQEIVNLLIACRREHGEDLPEVGTWVLDDDDNAQGSGAPGSDTGGDNE